MLFCESIFRRDKPHSVISHTLAEEECWKWYEQFIRVAALAAVGDIDIYIEIVCLQRQTFTPHHQMRPNLRVIESISMSRKYLHTLNKIKTPGSRAQRVSF